MTTYYHGAHTAYEPHEGQCYTDDRQVAEHFAGRSGIVATVELAGSLVVERCSGYDHETNYAPADDATYRAAAAERGVDILLYEDEDDRGAEATCWRIVSARALESLRVLAIEPAD